MASPRYLAAQRRRRQEWSRRAHAAKARRRMERPAPDYPAPPPDVYAIVTVDVPATGQRHRLVLGHGGRRRDQFAVRVDGRPWTVSCRSRLARALAARFAAEGRP